jgi:hypothetical protein
MHAGSCILSAYLHTYVQVLLSLAINPAHPPMCAGCAYRCCSVGAPHAAGDRAPAAGSCRAPGSQHTARHTLPPCPGTAAVRLGHHCSATSRSCRGRTGCRQFGRRAGAMPRRQAAGPKEAAAPQVGTKGCQPATGSGCTASLRDNPTQPARQGKRRCCRRKQQQCVAARHSAWDPTYCRCHLQGSSDHSCTRCSSSSRCSRGYRPRTGREWARGGLQQGVCFIGHSGLCCLRYGSSCCRPQAYEPTKPSSSSSSNSSNSSRTQLAAQPCQRHELTANALGHVVQQQCTCRRQLEQPPWHARVTFAGQGGIRELR